MLVKGAPGALSTQRGRTEQLRYWPSLNKLVSFAIQLITDAVMTFGKQMASNRR